MSSRARLPLALVLAAVGACSSSAAHPPVLTDCPPDSGCVASSSGGGTGSGSGGTGSSSGGGGTGSCTVDPAASQCSQCAQSRCCADLSTCYQDTTCENLLSCAAACTTTSCVSGCEQQYSAATPTYQRLMACLSTQCAVCSQAGAGDACTASSSACASGLTCNGAFCTRSCTQGSDCAGLGPSGGNLLGQPNACLRTASGQQCTPGCATDQDCGAFPGTFCALTTDSSGASVQVCAPVSDAGPG